MRCEVYGEFIRVRNDPKTTNTSFLKNSGLLTLKKEYLPSAFGYLIGSCHIDPDSLLAYKVIKIRVHRGRIVCDRELVKIGEARVPTKKSKFESIHAMDVVLYTLISNPYLQSPLLQTGDSLDNFLTSLRDGSTLVTSKDKISNRKRSRTEDAVTENSTLMRTLDPLLRDLPKPLDSSAKRRRSDRSKVLTTKVNLVRDRKDLDRVETLYAEDITIPKNHVQAIKSAFTIQWTTAEKDEIGGLKKKDTFETVDEINVPPGTKIIPGKWVYAIKVDSTGKVVRFKARLTARGDLVDAEELDFQDVFSPVVGWQGLRIFLALTTLLDLKPLQIDVDLAYLYANLEEPVYMRPPDGSGCPKGKVWKLKNLCMASRNPERIGIR